MKKFRAEFVFVSKWMACSLSQKSCHYSNTIVYRSLVNFLQGGNRIYCLAVEKFCDSIILRICELSEASTQDIERDVTLGVQGDTGFLQRLSLLTGGLLAFVRVQGISSVSFRRQPLLQFVLLHFMQDHSYEFKEICPKNVKYFWYSSWTGREQHVSLRFTEVNQACEIIQFFGVIYYIVKGRLSGGSSRNSNLNPFLTMSRIFSKKFLFVCL